MPPIRGRIEVDPTARPSGVSGAGRRLARWWGAVAHYLARAPATHVLFLVITVTTLVLRGVDTQTATRVLRHQSTNLVQMAHDAPRVLLLSAFVTTQGHLWWEFVRFTVVLVPLERWVGTYRWLAVFAAGHIGASTATTVAIWLQATKGTVGRDVLSPVDVGISYGLAAAAGVVVYRLPRPLALLAAAVLIAWTGAGVIQHGTFTDWGHLTALAIGFGIGPLIRPQHQAHDPVGVRHSRRTVAAAWGWIATPRAPVHLTRARTAPFLAAGCFAATAALAVAVPAARRQPVLVPPPGDIVRAVVVGRPSSCERPCRSAVVSYSSLQGAVQARLADVGGVLLRPGDRLAVRVDPTTPTVASLVDPAQRIRLDGFIGSAAVATFLVGIAILLAGRRTVADTTTPAAAGVS